VGTIKKEIKLKDAAVEVFLPYNGDKKALVLLHNTLRFHLEYDDQKLSRQVIQNYSR